MAVLTDGKKSITIISITESENIDANVTQYPVENGSPLSDHSQRTGKGISISGMILDPGASDKYKTLIAWQDKGVMLTYKGAIYHGSLLLSGLSKSHEKYKNGFAVTISLTVIQKATTSWKKKVVKKGKQQVTGKKTAAVYVTVKPGNTYWGWWQKYGTPIQTLRNWNKWPDRFIPIGKRARVK